MTYQESITAKKMIGNNTKYGIIDHIVMEKGFYWFSILNEKRNETLIKCLDLIR